MALRVFISFATEDIRYRDLLVGQAKNERIPFDFVDMSLQTPFDAKWKTRCREKIRDCHAFVALLSKKSWRASGARWEMGCAADEGIPSIGVHIHTEDEGAIPPELRGRVIKWRWASIARFLKQVDEKRSVWDKLFS